MSGVRNSLPEVRRIVLTGFMGSGKTTVGRVLAARLGWQFADLDERVEAREGLTVPQVFAKKGEAAFRVAETEALAELLQRTNLIIALGGGAPGTPAVRELLTHAAETAIVHLDAPFKVLYSRCTTQALDASATARPLLGEAVAAEARYTERRSLYCAVAHTTTAADAGSPEDVAAAILRSLLP